MARRGQPTNGCRTANINDCNARAGSQISSEIGEVAHTIVNVMIDVAKEDYVDLSIREARVVVVGENDLDVIVAL